MSRLLIIGIDWSKVLYFIGEKKRSRTIFVTMGSFFFFMFLNGDVNAQAPVSLGSIAQNVGQTVVSLATIISNMALVSGIGFVLASFFKFDAHKKNPTQIPISAPLTLLVIGASLCMFPTIMPMVQTAIFGTGAERGSVDGSGVIPLIGT